MTKGTLRKITHVQGVTHPFWADECQIMPFMFFLPLELVKKSEKKYRPFTLEEFIHTVGDVGDRVRYKYKDNPQIYRTIITEIREDSKYVMLGISLLSTERLFNEFEYYDNETWIPFGILEE